MDKLLKKHIPEKALDYVVSILKKYPCILKITSPRSTKFGDFKVLSKNNFQITINDDLLPEHFLLTLIHEIAHMVTYKEYGKSVKPHGMQWQDNFRCLMFPVLNAEVYSLETLPYLVRYLKKPKASSCRDRTLYKVLTGASQGLKTIFDLQETSEFIFKKRRFQLLEKKRTRALCIDIKTGQRYLISGYASLE